VSVSCVNTLNSVLAVRGLRPKSVRNQNADLFASDQAILKKYYRPSTLELERARRVFLLPEIFRLP